MTGGEGDGGWSGMILHPRGVHWVEGGVLDDVCVDAVERPGGSVLLQLLEEVVKAYDYSSDVVAGAAV